eukprot:11738374-Ditylum_brightwellii.AAC.1
MMKTLGWEIAYVNDDVLLAQHENNVPKQKQVTRLRDKPDAGFITGIDMPSKEKQEKLPRQKCCFEEEDIEEKQDSGEIEDENKEDEDDALIENEKQRSTLYRTCLG